MIRKTLIGVSLAVVTTLLLASPAGAVPSIDVDTEVTDASSGGCSNGTEVWTIEADVRVENSWEDGPSVIETVDFDAKYALNEGDPQTSVEGVTVLDDGGLEPAVSLAALEVRTFHVVLQVTLPCGVHEASIGTILTVEDRDKVYEEFDFFVTGGTAVPVGAIGAVGLAALAGVGLVVAQRRRGRDAS